MGELRVDTLSAENGTSPVDLTGQSAAKAWVSFNGTGTIAARDSLNVSSLTDNGSGTYDVSFTNNFDNADNYVAAGGLLTEGTERGAGGLCLRITSVAGGAPSSKTTSQTRFTAVYGSSASSDGAGVDTDPCYATFMGDLA